MAKENISYEDFVKLDLCVATVKEASFIEGADKLLKLTLDAGERGERTVASGIREWYSPEELVGKQVVYLANLEPRKLRGVESQGMIIMAVSDKPIFVKPVEEIANGATVR